MYLNSCTIGLKIGDGHELDAAQLSKNSESEALKNMGKVRFSQHVASNDIEYKLWDMRVVVWSG